MTPDVTFAEDATDFILECFDKEVDSEGYIVEADTGERVLQPSGREIKADELAITAEGSEIFIDDNFTSIIEYVESQQDQGE